MIKVIRNGAVFEVNKNNLIDGKLHIKMHNEGYRLLIDKSKEDKRIAAEKKKAVKDSAKDNKKEAPKEDAK